MEKQNVESQMMAQNCLVFQMVGRSTFLMDQLSNILFLNRFQMKIQFMRNV